MRNLVEARFGGDVLPVNPSGEPILGVPSVPRAADLPEGLDLALVSLPAAAVLDAVRQLGARRCRYCVVLASGFGETGQAGQAEQAELAGVARATGTRIVGPNCMGVVNVPGRLNGSYFWDVPEIAGGVSFVSQSGAYGGLFFREVRTRGFGVARFLSVGNQVDVGFEECLEWLAADAATRVIGLFVEGVRDGRAFVEAARRATRVKPVVALKGGRAEAGRRAAASHTGSLAGNHETYQAAFRAAGIVPVDETEELFDALVALDAQSGRLPRDSSIAILTISGGPSVVAADCAEAVGLRVPPLPETTQRALRDHLPAFGAVLNPVDMTPQIEPGGFGPVVGLVLADPSVSGALAIDVGLDRGEYGDALVAAQAGTGKPVVACTVDTPGIDRRLREAGIASFPAPERAVRAYRALVAAAGARAAERRGVGGSRRPAAVAAECVGPRASPDPRARAMSLRLGVPLDGVRGMLAPETAEALLRAYGIGLPRQGTVTALDGALRVAGEIGYPVVVKTARSDLVHKTDVGGVLLGVGDADALRRAWETLHARVGLGPVLIQESVSTGSEWLIGGRRDPVFGPTVLVGVGGIWTELVRDISLRLAPLEADDARAALGEGRRAALLAGFRGQEPVDEAALARVVVAVGDLLTAHPEVEELDLNPVIVGAGRPVAVDARILLAAGGTTGAAVPVAGGTERSAAAPAPRNPTDGGHHP